MPDGSSSMRPIQKTVRDCPVYWRRIGTPLAFLVAGWPLLLLLVMNILFVIPKQNLFTGTGGPVYGFVWSLMLQFWVWPFHITSWRFGKAVDRGIANLWAWSFCELLGFASGALILYGIFSPLLR